MNEQTSFEQIPDFVKEEEAFYPFQVYYYRTLIDQDRLQRDILKSLVEHRANTIEDVEKSLPVGMMVKGHRKKEIHEKLLQGYVCIQHVDAHSALLVQAISEQNRAISIPEVEFSVLGPKQSFIEALDTNLSLIRKRLPIPQLQIEEVIVGKLTKSTVNVLSIKGITDEENVQTVVQRLKDVDYDHVMDSSYLIQFLEDNSKSVFPQLIDTERPDRAVAALVEGKVVFLMDGSPQAVIGPITLIEFFSAFEDYYLSWQIASALRLIRIFAVLFSIFATPLYVAVLTYHPELIPNDLLGTLVSSRSGIPFPPILEAIFLEITIELLREAGARLPTKVGQTIGIVGGIVIGTASVEAGLTSNVLLIIVALSALASFTTPVYRMGNTIRLIRFPLLIASNIWGMLSLMLGLTFFIVHLINLKSLGRPYMEPLYPLRLADWKDAIIRLPFSMQKKRPIQERTKKSNRFKTRMNDIDER
ncbi:spore germination protein [Metabacillus iocasae]|uniref:Uncharacterized protein n=1 Tax=Priestia iocasae TaxID=2291674 RepID=A0ABS2QS46_9BACI|nr:spore germination protein [Metabacillus iocasae]MBM7702033.1 hypothetical protein [Metabacillus iocasae]